MKSEKLEAQTFGTWQAGSILLAVILLVASSAAPALAGDGSDGLELALSVTTTGPPWPPSEVMDANGDFIAIGSILEELPGGQGFCFGAPAVACFGPPRAVIVSKDTVPPLDDEGREDFANNLFGAAHTVVRSLDLSEGSPDLDLVLYSSSFGPAKGDDFAGGPRIPALGDSLYNLNSLPATCPELFPSSEQEEAYVRGAFPIHQAPIWGFEGDGIRYDPTTGAPIPGFELPRDSRPRSEPITLGDWLEADQRSKLDVELVDFDPQQDAYTAAKFEFRFKDLVPNAVYTIWSLRLNTLIPPQGGEIALPGPLCLPNVFSTDDKGKARFSCKVENPFPGPNQGLASLLRVQGVTVAFHNTYQSWGSCFARYGVAVDHHVHLTTGLSAFDTLVTTAKP